MSSSSVSLIKDCFAFLNTTNWHRVALLLFVGLLGVGYGVGFSVATQNAKKKADDDYSKRLEIFSEWQMKITSHFARAGSLAASVAAFGFPSAIVPANLSAPPMDRVVSFNADAYFRMCQGLEKQTPGFTTLEIQTGGVISIVYPPGGQWDAGFDVIGLAEDQGYEEILRTGEPIVAGPAMIFTGDYGIFIRYPIYVNGNKTRENFWGTGNVVMLIVDLLNALNISSLPNDLGMEYASWYVTKKLGTTTVLATTDSQKTDLIMRSGMRMQLPVAEPGKVAYLAMYPTAGVVSENIDTGLLALVVLVVLAGAVLFVITLYVALFAMFAYNHRYAPTAYSAVPSNGSDENPANKLGASASNTVSPQQQPQQQKHYHRAKDGSHIVFVAAITLRGAQPIADRAPLESVKMFAKFFAIVRRMSYDHQCYPVCEIGDRTMYVVSSDPSKIASLAKAVTTSVTIQCDIRPSHPEGLGTRVRIAADNATLSVRRMSAGGFSTNPNTAAPSLHTTNTHLTHHNNANISMSIPATPKNSQSPSLSQNPSTHCNSSHHSNDNAMLLNDIKCRPSIGCHAIANMPSCYDPIRDKYFYGNTAQLAALGAAVDEADSREVCWTYHFNKQCELATVADTRTPIGTPIAAKSSSNKFLTTRVVRERSGGNAGDSTSAAGRVTYFAARWDDENDDDEESDAEGGDDGVSSGGKSDDPSIAMAVMGDAYVKRMAVTAGKQQRDNRRKEAAKNGAKNDCGAGGGTGGAGGGSGGQSGITHTCITRSATVLHIAFDYDARKVIDIVRRVVGEERGAVVSAHGPRIVAAFNLLSPGGHHQMRAADVVMKLRAELDSVPFVCSIHHGKVDALVAEGMVMCVGEAVAVGQQLLERAVQLANLTPSSVGGAGANVAMQQQQQQLRHRKSASAAIMVQSHTTATTTEGFSTTEVFTTGAPITTSPMTSLFHNNNTGKNLMKEFAASITTTSSVAATNHGLCLLYCYNDLNTAYDCEAIDVVECEELSNTSNSLGKSNNRKRHGGGGAAKRNGQHHHNVRSALSDQELSPVEGGEASNPLSNPSHGGSSAATSNLRVLYRLGHLRSPDGNRVDDEWMYQLREGEQRSAFAQSNKVFAKIAEGDIEGAKELLLQQSVKGGEGRRGSAVATTDDEKNTNTAPRDGTIRIFSDDGMAPLGDDTATGVMSAFATQALDRLFATREQHQSHSAL